VNQSSVKNVPQSTKIQRHKQKHKKIFNKLENIGKAQQFCAVRRFTQPSSPLRLIIWETERLKTKEGRHKMLAALLSTALVSRYRCQRAREKQTQKRKKEKIRDKRETKKETKTHR
jgi:hypothetical protein